jgi:hypothetical protein
MSTAPTPELMARILMRIEHIETQLSQQQQTFVPSAVNDLRLQLMQESIKRVEQNQIEIGKKMDEETKKRDAFQKKIFFTFLTLITTIIGGIIIYYATHGP